MSFRGRGGPGGPGGFRGAPRGRGGPGGPMRGGPGGPFGGRGGYQGGGGGFDNSGNGGPPPFKRARREEPENHVLLMTVENARYPITVKVIEAICRPLGAIQRIVVFKKNAVQALVEFDSVETARDVKDQLQGADIYSGCCTLNIEYGKPTKLTVRKNDDETWDYTNPNLPSSLEEANGFGGQRRTLLEEPPRGPPSGGPGGLGGRPGGGYGGMGGYDDGGYGGPGPSGGRGGGGFNDMGGGDGSWQQMGGQGGPGMGMGGMGMGMGMGPGPSMGMGMDMGMGMGAGRGGGQGGCVVMVYGLNMEKMNADRLFNLLCLYGNVLKIKFLKSKEGTAMVEMSDPEAVAQCIDQLHNLIIFGNRLQLRLSKQEFVTDTGRSYELDDGTPSFMDYSQSRNNRFLTPEQASKNRLQPPGKSLHFYNSPPKMSVEDVRKIFEDVGAPAPVDVIPLETKAERSSAGTLIFKNDEDAVNALILANHKELKSPEGKFPFIFKVCFSSNVPGGSGRFPGGPRGGGGGGMRGGFRGGRGGGGGGGGYRGYDSYE